MTQTQTKEDYNFSVLSKHDNATAQVFFTSPICDVYEYNQQSGEWKRLDCKGTLFLYSRKATDGYPYAAIVLNRQNNQDFTLGIRPSAISGQRGEEPMQVALDENLLMISNGDNVYGLWLFSEQDRQTCLSLLEWCLSNGSA